MCSSTLHTPCNFYYFWVGTKWVAEVTYICQKEVLRWCDHAGRHWNKYGGKFLCMWGHFCCSTDTEIYNFWMTRRTFIYVFEWLTVTLSLLCGWPIPLLSSSTGLRIIVFVVFQWLNTLQKHVQRRVIMTYIYSGKFTSWVHFWTHCTVINVQYFLFLFKFFWFLGTYWNRHDLNEPGWHSNSHNSSCGVQTAFQMLNIDHICLKSECDLSDSHHMNVWSADASCVERHWNIRRAG